MQAKPFLIVLILVLAGFCAGAFPGTAGAARGPAETIVESAQAYKQMEARLSEDQKAEFMEAYNHVVSALQTSAVLLTSIVDAADEASSHTAVISYLSTAGELPRLIDKVQKIVQGFKKGSK
jgi:hypothetical protein